ncbi:hypothetical protein AAFC00_000178 [Neodothiora populina]|uniref:CCD97-like C-terminal domain-containing protein n=1 Tax=Neodothiora populina TaxID=2781224 RepID=A0ABR3P211_9PEZI
MPHFPKDTVSVSSDSRHESEEARTARLQVKTRRRKYLEKHAEYFDSATLELADPLLYDRMVRRFQTTAEREAYGKKQGWSGIMEADIMRSEAKVAALQNPDPNSPLVYKRDAAGSIIAVEQDEEDRPKDRQQGLDKWRYAMEQRFLRGQDHDFDYGQVDGNDEYDDWEEETRRRQDDYFDQEAAEFVGEEISRTGETGIQDF